MTEGSAIDFENLRDLNASDAYRFWANFGLNNKTNLYWYYNPKYGLNFGDWIGPYLFNKKTGLVPTCFQPDRRRFATCYFTSGSILHFIRKKNTALVWGSGAIKADIKFPRPKKIYAVRGPLTDDVCRKFGYECPSIYGDPAILLPRYYSPPRPPTRFALGVIPHHIDHEIALGLFADAEDTCVIDVRQPVETVVDAIVQCERIVSSSLHGLIVSHGYGLRAAWARFSDRIIGGNFKFLDYYLSGGGEPGLRPLEMSSPIPRSDLIAMIDESPIPDIQSLSSGLMSSCPF